MKDIIWYNHADRGDNKIAITFDDGPNPYHTLAVLDILDQERISAAFFLLGIWTEKFPGIAREIVQRGHLIGNHSYSHTGDFDRADEVFLKVLGFSPSLLRIPYGAGNPKTPWPLWFKESRILQEPKRKVVDFDVVVEDWKNPGSKEIASRVISKTQNGSIILLHDGSEKESELQSRPTQMVQALPEIIEELKAREFSFSRADKLKLEPYIFNDNKLNPD